MLNGSEILSDVFRRFSFGLLHPTKKGKTEMSSSVNESARETSRQSGTYSMAEAPPSPMQWDEYIVRATGELSALRENRRASEAEYQSFFERHPVFLPQIYNTHGVPDGHHGPYPSAVVSQPVLPGFSRKIPDFLYLSRNSESAFAVLIEIERPDKRWATRAGHPSAQFTQAQHQIAEWKAWFSEPNNVQQFLRLYRVPDWLRDRTFRQKYILVYGQRSDPTLTEAFRRRRGQLPRENEEYMTFDRLSPQKYWKNVICTKVDEDGYRAIEIPPTLRLGPLCAENFLQIRDKEVATRGNRYLSDERKRFLVDRWEYWDTWARTPRGFSFMGSGDWE